MHDQTQNLLYYRINHKVNYVFSPCLLFLDKNPDKINWLIVTYSSYFNLAILYSSNTFEQISFWAYCLEFQHVFLRTPHFLLKNAPQEKHLNQRITVTCAGFGNLSHFYSRLHGDTCKILGPFWHTMLITWGDPEATAHSTSLLWVTPVRTGLTSRLVHGFRHDSNNLHLSNCNSAVRNVAFFYVELFSLDITHRLASCLYWGSARVAAAACVWRAF